MTTSGLVTVGLIMAGWRIAHRPVRPGEVLDRPPPPPAGVTLAAFLAGGTWFALLIPSVSNDAVARVSPALAISFAVLVAATAVIVVWHWSGARRWGDQHRLALITGAMTASMAAGFLANQAFRAGPDRKGRA